MFLLDTNVISELRRGPRCDAGVAHWYGNVADEELRLSVLTLGEIRKGVELSRLRQDAQQADVLELWLHAVMSRFADRILPIDAAVADAWGRLYRIRNIPVIDGLLAATAKVNDLTLVTRNIDDVRDLGVDLLNPFSAQLRPGSP